MARDTSGAVALAAVIGRARFPGSTMVVLPADHVIKPEADFVAAVANAAKGAASSEALDSMERKHASSYRLHFVPAVLLQISCVPSA